MSVYLHHFSAYTPAECIPGAALVLSAGRIHALGPRQVISPPPGAEILDLQGMLLAPGLIDLQLNGAFGWDFTSQPDAIWQVAARLPRFGVTAFLPTLISPSPQCIRRAQHALQAGPPPGFKGAMPLGLHLEGPYLNPKKRGAHPAASLRLPQAHEWRRWSLESGVRLVTLAPELPGALPAITALAAAGVVVGAGHSLADYTAAKEALAAGVRYATHLFNAMPLFHQRRPGLAAALLDDERVLLGLIADGVHLHPALLRLVWRLAPGRVNLVSDAVAALEAENIASTIAGQSISARGDVPRLADGTLAGSILTLDTALRNMLSFCGCSLSEVLPALTSTPARLLGVASMRGELAVGARGDLLVLTPGLAIHKVFVGGELVYRGA